jgi:hypothetical protein
MLKMFTSGLEPSGHVPNLFDVKSIHIRNRNPMREYNNEFCHDLAFDCRNVA